MLIPRKDRPVRLARRASAKPRVERLEDRTLLSTSWNNFGGNAQHTSISTVAAQPIDSIHWQTSMDLDPQADVPVHYGEPVFTPNNTVIVPVKTGASGGFEVQAYNGATGNLLWTVQTDYQEAPYNWLPPFQPVYSAVNNRVYFPGDGGTVYYVNNPDNANATISGQVAFFGTSTYQSNRSAFNSSIEIDTPLIVDNSGNVYFGFMVTGSNPLGLTNPGGGIARVSATGAGTYVQAFTAAGGADSTITRPALGSAPALSNDGSVLYVAVNGTGTGQGDAYLLGLNSTTLTTEFNSGVLMDPRSTQANPLTDSVIDESTAAPMVAPDGTVFFGTFGNLNNYNGSRGFLLHFSANLQTEYTPGAFGWDDTVSIIPASMVPSYTGTSTYLILAKYNDYVAGESTVSGGNGVNKIAILDPYATEPDPNNDSIPPVVGTSDPSLLVMKEIETITSPTPDSDWTSNGYPDAVDEWCTNGTAVDPATDSVFINNEDGYAYRWNLSTDTLTQAIQISPGISEPYTPTAIGPDGTVYAVNGGSLFALGGPANYSLTNVPSANSSNSGQSVTFTTTLASTNGGAVPTGVITYELGLSVLGTETLVDGVASFTTSSLPIGHDHVEAVYGGDPTYSGASTTLVLPVLDESSTLVVSNANPSTFGQSVTLTATVSPLNATSFVPLGSVTFMEGSTVLGTVPLNASDQASFTTSGLTGGNASITAVYNGDQNFAAGTSPTFTQMVQQDETYANLLSSLSPSAFGESVTFTATISTDPLLSIVPTGLVYFYDAQTLLGTSSVINESAQFSISSLSLGNHTISAVYGGDVNYEDSQSGNLTQVVTLSPTTTAASDSSITFNASSQSVILNALVMSEGEGVNEGTVTFTVFTPGDVQVGTPVTSGTVAGGEASASFVLPAGEAPGSYTIEADYNPGVDYQSSSDSSGTLTVDKLATAISAVNGSAIYNPAGESVILTANVTSGGNAVSDGTVTFTLVGPGNVQVGTPVMTSMVAGGSVVASYQLPAGTLNGAYSIVATYSGTADLASSTDNSHDIIVSSTQHLAPQLAPVNGSNVIALPQTQFPYSGTVNAVSLDGNPITYSVSASGDSLLYDLQQKYQFTAVGNFTVGASAYVLHSSQPGPGFSGYYLLRPSDGALFAYDNSGNYSTTFANGTPLATLGANVYTDPSLLLGALPPADYSGLQALQQQYQFTGVGYFTAGTAAYVLHSNQTGPGVSGYYLIRPSDGAVFAYDGSGSYAQSFVSSTPLATPGTSIYSYPMELIDAQASPSLYAQLYQVDQQLDLHEYNGSFYTNNLGNQAEWLYSPVLNQYGEHWYTLIQSGGNSVLHAWQGYQDSSIGAVVATFSGASVYNNPTLLTNATYLANPAVTASINASGMLSIGLPSSSYVGIFNVVVTASDGSLSTSETVKVSSTDTAPTLSIQQNGATVAAGSTLNVPHGSFPLSDSVTATATNGQMPATTVSVSNYSQLFNLEQQYRFQGLGTFMTTVSGVSTAAYVMSAAGNNSLGNPYYLLSTSGNLYAYDGSGNYATSMAGSPLASLGSTVYGDPTLLLNAQPPVDYSQLNSLETTYQFQGMGYFNVGAPAYVLAASTKNSFGNPYYLLSPSGSLYAYNPAGNYAFTYANVTPTAIGLDPGVYANPALLLNAKAAPALYPQLQQIEQQFDLQELSGGFYTGLRGNAAKWLFSPVANVNGQHYYTLVLSANGTQASLYASDGGSSSIPTTGTITPVAVLDASVYADPTLLLNAKAPEAATGVSATVNNGTLTINSPATFVGAFQVSVTTTDGSLSSTLKYQINATDTPPVPNTIPDQTASSSGSPLQLTLGATDAENDAVSYTAAAPGYSAAYNLQQQYQFTGIGKFTTTVGGMSTTAYVLHSNVLGGSGGYYLLSNTGGVYAYDGSGNYATTFANSNNLIATLSPSIFATPALLTAAQAPTVPGAVLSVAGNTLTVNVAGVTVGTVFEVILTASDGAETTRTSFLVTVTA